MKNLTKKNFLKVNGGSPGADAYYRMNDYYQQEYDNRKKAEIIVIGVASAISAIAIGSVGFGTGYAISKFV
jgi:hypothetical protein